MSPITAKGGWFYYNVGCVVHRKWFRIRCWKPKYSTLHMEQVLLSYLAPPILLWQPTLMNWNCGGYLKSQVRNYALLCCWRFIQFNQPLCGSLGPSWSDCEMGWSYLGGNLKMPVWMSVCFRCPCRPLQLFWFNIYVFLLIWWFLCATLLSHGPSVSPSCLSSGLQGKPLCWAVLVQDRQIKLLLSSGPEIYILDDTSCSEVVRQTNGLIDYCRESTSMWKRFARVSDDISVFSILRGAVPRAAASSTCLCRSAINIWLFSLTLDTCSQPPLISRWAARWSKHLFYRTGGLYLNEWLVIFICRTNWVKLTPKGWRHLSRWSGM